MFSPLSKYKQYYAYWPLAVVILLGLYNVYGNVFIQDDAYISYNYAKWFSRGFGLVWYPNSTEFGYTNFLYTFMIGVAMLFGASPEIASNFINVASFVGCLILVYKFSVCLLATHDSRFTTPFCAIILLSTHHTFTAYATGGLETMFVTLLILAFYWQILRDDRNYILIGTIAALALLTRLDTSLLLFSGYVYILVISKRFSEIKEAIIIPAITTLGLLIACYFAYGYALPNTFYVKMPGSESMVKYGLRYLWLYNMLHMYLPLLVPLLIIYFFAGRDSFARLGKEIIMISSVLLIWLCYVIYVGGDFMEFRFLVPILPFYYVVIIRLIQALIPKYKTQTIIAITSAFLIGNALHPSLFTSKPNHYDFPMKPKEFEYAYVENTETLNDWLSISKINWILIGKSLHQLFYSGSDSDVKIAVGNAGAIPFYSDIFAFDIMGLNSRAVIMNHKAHSLRPGHKIIATEEVIKSEGINLGLAFTHTICRKNNRFEFSGNIVVFYPFKRNETLLIPIGKECYVIADYITPHPRIEELLKDKVILRYRDIAGRSNCPKEQCLH